MICEPCATAADIATVARAGLDQIAWTWPAGVPGVGGTEREVTPELLEEIHQHCRGCDCQHRVQVTP